jgi:hypothetical protein
MTERMFESAAAELAGIHRRLASVAAAFDGDGVSAEEAGEIVRIGAGIEAMASTVKALAAARLAETTRWREAGDRTPAHHLARVTGTTVSQAGALLDAASRLSACPATEAAARAGELSPQQVVAIVDATTADPSAERRLVGTAGTTTLAELRDECARTKAAALPDPEAHHRMLHAGRFARRRTCADGAAEIHYRSTPEDVAHVWAVVEGYTEREFRRAREEGRRESFDAYAADALLAMARAAIGAGAGEGSATGRRAPSPAKVVVRVDSEALRRGRVDDGEVCEIAGVGPVPVRVVRDLLAHDDPFVAAVVTRGVDVLNVAHLGRRATAVQRTALEWLSPTCAALGCTQTARLEIDHRIDWAGSYVTKVTALDPLCHHHHALKTRSNWQLVEGRGKRRMVPPDDPEHPAHRSRAGPAVARSA